MLLLFHGDTMAVPPGDEPKPESMELKRNPPRRPGGEACRGEDCKRVVSLGPGDCMFSNDTPPSGTDSVRAAAPRGGESLGSVFERLERSTCDFRERSRSKRLNGTDIRLSPVGLIYRTEQK
mmetsp:Transcript_89559/g.178027  ORF Transcript_89559/g.178027 Transcript_89559/m.178027 type:complete len:122 (-) Transcript_89559:2159-2524(-)